MNFDPTMNLATKLVGALFKGLIRGYQWLVAPVLGPGCRYYPSCSNYALEAIEHFGAVGGTWLAVKRIARCHPWGGSGVDPVPEGRNQYVPEGTGRQTKIHHHHHGGMVQ